MRDDLEMYFEEFCEERNIKEETIRQYKGTLNKYSQYYDMSIDDLIDEAIDEENEGIDKRRRSIKTRLLQFRTYLVTEANLKPRTIQKHMSNLYAFYHHFDIELPKLPKIKFDEEEMVQTTYFDLPTREQIGMAVELAGIRVGSLILFMASSGTGRTECANMTIGDFINACTGFYTAETLPEIIEELANSIEPIVPTFYLWRQKTSKKYYTFCTPETTNAIVEWLQLRLKINEEDETELSMEDSLWDLSQRQITYHISNINDELGFGFKGSYRFLRPHSIRKFNASNIGLSEDKIDLLQGRSRDKIHETYIKTNPEELKQIYMNVMDNVTISKLGKKEIHHEEFTINLNLNFYGDGYGITI